MMAFCLKKIDVIQFYPSHQEGPACKTERILSIHFTGEAQRTGTKTNSPFGLGFALRSGPPRKPSDQEHKVTLYVKWAVASRWKGRQNPTALVSGDFRRNGITWHLLLSSSLVKQSCHTEVHLPLGLHTPRLLGGGKPCSIMAYHSPSYLNSITQCSQVSQKHGRFQRREWGHGLASPCYITFCSVDLTVCNFFTRGVTGASPFAPHTPPLLFSFFSP